jgi:hypothetical protein
MKNTSFKSMFRKNRSWLGSTKSQSELSRPPITGRLHAITILRSCLDAITAGEVPASVAGMINMQALEASEEDFLKDRCLRADYWSWNVTWIGCGILEIVALVDSEMHRIEHPAGCEDRATCRRDREEREKRALASAYESLKVDPRVLVPSGQPWEADYGSDGSTKSEGSQSWSSESALWL